MEIKNSRTSRSKTSPDLKARDHVGRPVGRKRVPDAIDSATWSPATPELILGGDTALSRSLGYALRRAQLSTYAEFSRFMGEFDVRPSEFSVLVLVGQHPGVNQSAIGAALDIKKTNMVPLLDRLEKHRLLERRQVPADRRLVALHLTSRGVASLRRMEARHEQMESVMRQRLGDARSRQFLKLLHDFKCAYRPVYD